MGGPIVRNKLVVFGALQGRWRGQALPSLASADPLTLTRLGVSPDSASRFLALAAASGAPAQVQGLSDERTTDNTVAFLRFDWKVSEAQTLTLRLDGRWDSQQPTRVSPLGLPPTGGTRTERGGGVMASLTSHFAGSLINEVRGYFSAERRDATALVPVPAGRVQVASDLPDGRHGVATLAFGGNAGLPQRIDNVGLELSEELSWLPGGGAHRPKLGALLSGTGLDQNQTPNQLGTFVFPSLSALAADSPASFSRVFAPVVQRGPRGPGTLQRRDGARLHRSGGPDSGLGGICLGSVHDSGAVRGHRQHSGHQPAPERHRIRPRLRTAACVARFLGRAASPAPRVHGVARRELRAWLEPVRLPRLEPGRDAALHAPRRSRPPGVRAGGLHRPRPRRARCHRFAGAPGVRGGARHRVRSPIGHAAGHPRSGRRLDPRRSVAPVVHLHARPRPVVVLVLCRVPWIRRAHHRHEP